MTEQDDRPVTPDDTAASAETQNTDTAASTDQPNRIPLERFNEVNERRKQAEERLAALERAESERQQQAAIARGEHEQVIAQLRADLDAANAQLETGQSYRDALMASVQKRVESIPEARRSLVPGFDDPVKLADWLDNNQHLLVTPTPPPTGAGLTGDRKPASMKLTPEQQKMARMFGMTDEEYAKGLLGAETDRAARDTLPPDITNTGG